MAAGMFASLGEQSSTARPPPGYRKTSPAMLLHEPLELVVRPRVPSKRMRRSSACGCILPRWRLQACCTRPTLGERSCPDCMMGSAAGQRGSQHPPRHRAVDTSCLQAHAHIARGAGSFASTALRVAGAPLHLTCFFCFPIIKSESHASPVTACHRALVLPGRVAYAVPDVCACG